MFFWMAAIATGVAAVLAGAVWVNDGGRDAALVAVVGLGGFAALCFAFGLAQSWSKHCPFCGQELTPTPATYFKQRDRVTRNNRIWCEGCGHIQVDRVCL